MNKTTVWLIIAASLVIIGLMVFVIEMTVLGWDFSRLSSAKYESVTHDIEASFHSISIDTKTADIIFLPAEDGKGRVVADETEKLTYSVSVKDGTLMICLVDATAWYDCIDLFGVTPKLTVYLPQKEYDSLIIKGKTGDVDISKDFTFERLAVEIFTGDILVEHITAGALDLHTTTGDITIKHVRCRGQIDMSIVTGKTELADVRCKSLRSEGTTGDLCMKNVIAEEDFFIKRITGDVTFDACDAAEMTIRATTGDVKGSLLSPKIFTAKVTTGDVDVPSSNEGGKCEITTTTGDIQIKIVKDQPNK